jgi:hypothetical protein
MDLVKRFKENPPSVREIMEDEELKQTIINNALKTKPIIKQIMEYAECDESEANTMLDNILTNNTTVQRAIKLAIQKEYELK